MPLDEKNWIPNVEATIGRNVLPPAHGTVLYIQQGDGLRRNEYLPGVENAYDVLVINETAVERAAEETVVWF